MAHLRVTSLSCFFLIFFFSWVLKISFFCASIVSRVPVSEGYPLKASFPFLFIFSRFSFFHFPNFSFFPVFLEKCVSFFFSFFLYSMFVSGFKKKKMFPPWSVLHGDVVS